MIHQPITPSFNPDAFRMTTDKQDQSAINGVAFNYTFVCKVCREAKSIKGRKSLGRKAGYSCAACHERDTEMSAAVSADKTTPPSLGCNPRVASDSQVKF